MANLIILEGVSRTGKSTISEILSDKFDYRNVSIKNKNPEFVENLPDFYHGMHVIANEFFASFQNETFVLDRSFLSELVYSKAFKRKTYLSEDDCITNMLTRNNFVLINLTNTYRGYLDRMPKDRKIYSEQEFNVHRYLFSHFFHNYKNLHSDRESRFLELNTNENSIEKCVKEIELTLEKNNILNTSKI